MSESMIGCEINKHLPLFSPFPETNTNFKNYIILQVCEELNQKITGFIIKILYYT